MRNEHRRVRVGDEFHDDVHVLDPVALVVWVLAPDHLDQDYPHRPHVAIRGVFSTHDAFRGHVYLRGNHCVAGVQSMLQFRALPQVRDLDLPLRV